jgi:pectate lyase
VLTENNHFISQKEPIDLGKQEGPGSVQQAVGNLFESCSGNQTGSGTAFTPPYEYKSFMVPAAEVKALVQKYAGATLASPTACN